MIWGDVSRKPQTKRFEALSAELTLCGVEQKYEEFALGELTLESRWPEIQKKGYGQIRVGRDEGMQVSAITHEVPRDVTLLGCADALVCENHKWVARSFFFDAIIETMAQNVRDLDFSAGALIIGAHCEARVLAFALSQIGFRYMTIAGDDDAGTNDLIKDLNRKCFGVEFSATPLALITQLPATNCVAVNTLSTEQNDALVSELSYFNFLRHAGVWIETSSESVTSPLVQEAQDLGLQTIRALDVMVHVDALWAKNCFSVTIDQDRLLKSWSEKLAASS